MRPQEGAGESLPQNSSLASGSSLCCDSLSSVIMWLSPFVCVCIQISPFYKDTGHIGYTLLLYDLIVTNFFNHSIS